SVPASQERNGESAPGSLAGRRILVVDDNRDAAESLAMLLTALGADVQVAFDGKAAIEAVRVNPPALALLDLGMPEMDGYAVAAALRRQPGHRNLRVVAVTGWGQPIDLQRTNEAGFDGHLVKPVTAQQVVDQLR